MAPISPVPPTTAASAPGGPGAEDALKAAQQGGGTFNWVINALGNLANNQAFILELFQTWLGAVKDFSGNLQDVENAMHDLLSGNPQNAAQDIKTIQTDLGNLSSMAQNLANKLTNTLIQKYGYPLPEKWQQFVDDAYGKLHDLVQGVTNQLQSMWSDGSNPPWVNGIVGPMLQLISGQTLTPSEQAAFAQAFSTAAQNMTGQNNQITPTWTLMNALEGSMTQGLENAQFLNATVSAREQQVASEIQSLFQGMAKTVSKQFQTLMAMIRLIVNT